MSTTSRRRAARLKRDEARERILAAAAEMLETQSYRDLRVDELMAAAGLSRTVFYRHFDGLPEVVLVLLERIRTEMLAPIERPRDEHVMEETLGHAVQMFARHGRLLRAVTEAASHDEAIEAAYDAFVQRSIDRTAELLAEGMAAGEVKPGDPHELARALTHMNAAYLFDTLGRDPSFDQRLALETLALVWSGIACLPT